MRPPIWPYDLSDPTCLVVVVFRYVGARSYGMRVQEAVPWYGSCIKVVQGSVEVPSVIILLLSLLINDYVVIGCLCCAC